MVYATPDYQAEFKYFESSLLYYVNLCCYPVSRLSNCKMSDGSSPWTIKKLKGKLEGKLGFILFIILLIRVALHKLKPSTPCYYYHECEFITGTSP